MKNHNSIFYTILLAAALFAGCKGDDPQPETQRVQKLLSSGTWQIDQVWIDEADQTSFFSGLTLSFTKAAYATTNGKAVWPASGTWEFADNSADKIIRDDGIEVTVLEVTKTSLKLSLTNPTIVIGSAKASGLAGAHEFHFVKN